MIADAKINIFIFILSVGYLSLSIYENRQFLFFKIKRFFYKNINQQAVLSAQSSYDVVQLIIKPQHSDFFDSLLFETGIKKLGLVFGEDQFFHKIHEKKIIYSVCHLYPPGTFAQQQLDRASYSGCKFFLVIDQRDFNSFKFDLLLKDAQALAEHLDAILIDEVENPLTHMSIEFIKQKIALRSYYKNLLQE
jgi:FtsZ-interacting cell division protein ZipA